MFYRAQLTHIAVVMALFLIGNRLGSLTDGASRIQFDTAITAETSTRYRRSPGTQMITVVQRIATLSNLSIPRFWNFHLNVIFFCRNRFPHPIWDSHYGALTSLLSGVDSLWWSRSLPAPRVRSRAWQCKEYPIFIFLAEVVNIWGLSGRACCDQFQDRRIIELSLVHTEH
jgi:hypothetical protein